MRTTLTVFVLALVAVSSTLLITNRNHEPDHGPKTGVSVQHEPHHDASPKPSPSADIKEVDTKDNHNSETHNTPAANHKKEETQAELSVPKKKSGSKQDSTAPQPRKKSEQKKNDKPKPQRKRPAPPQGLCEWDDDGWECEDSDDDDEDDDDDDDD